jgi:signal peptidase I
MSPTLNPNDDKERDVVLVLKTNQVNINDICLLKHPMDLNLTLIKRIRGLPGDWAFYQNRGQTVPEGFVFVQSDEPYRTTDSREFGPIPRGLVVGKALAVIWPLSHIKWL